MGTDVHAVWQARKNGQWQDIASTWDQRRHYLLFSWLANVRNGFGFAGVPTYDPVEPIAMPRGLPDDFEGGEDHPTTLEAINPRSREYMEAEELVAPVAWLGDHTHSWLTADEILAAKMPATVRRTGVVPIEVYKAWDGKTQPEAWSGGISGQDIRVATMPSKIAPDTTHVQIEWDGPVELDYFVNEVKRLKELHGDVRLVFGFDS